MPPLVTFVARLSDGLPLVANTAPDMSSGVTQEHKNQAKDILRGLGGTRYVRAELFQMCTATTGTSIFVSIYCECMKFVAKDVDRYHG